MKKIVFLLSGLFLLLSVSDSETLAQGSSTFKASFRGGYVLLEITGNTAKVGKYPGVYYNNCQICNPHIWECNKGYDGKIRLGVAGSQCSIPTRPALTAIQNYCTKSCSINLYTHTPPSPLPPKPPPSPPAPTPTPMPAPKPPSNNYVTFSGSFNGGYINIKIAKGKAKVVMYPGVTYTDCKICQPSIWSCSAGTDGKKRLGTGGSKCSSVPSSAMKYIRSYCSQSCSINSNPPPPAPSSRDTVIVLGDPVKVCGQSGSVDGLSDPVSSSDAGNAACTECYLCSEASICIDDNGVASGCVNAHDAGYTTEWLQANGSTCEESCPAGGGGGGGGGIDPPPPIPTPDPPPPKDTPPWNPPINPPINPPAPPPPPIPPDSLTVPPADTTSAPVDSTKTTKKEPCMCNGQKVDSTICDIIEEYGQAYYDGKDHKHWETPYWTPRCTDFKQTGGHKLFPWKELNGGWVGGNEKQHEPHGIIHPKLLGGLLVIRGVFKKAMPVTSGYRCPVGNDKAGSIFKDTSRHMYGMAADVRTGRPKGNPVTHARLVEIRNEHFTDFSYTEWGTYPGGHIHFQLIDPPPYPLTTPPDFLSTD